MLIKNKLYILSIITLMIIDIILINNDNVIKSPIGYRLIYLIMFISFLMIVIGTTVRKRNK
ncbi:hypothetical protein BU629_07870 [Staphylococcus capitis]|uniref:hypothetical protein n=1 Tax=Staphylococcus capitis TaxID=29388 RepID=UPI0004A0C1B2|nr:hypothetical protein CM54_02420 [Staphylococcus sp. TE8]PTG27445.1 hypothetical protein BU628_01555 [Staphylococcus capitis]PTG29015.1 hypothetical protein BU630_11800 [Staphylococcus capitis]PTH00949.1 hypothetical protein BU625_00380 [Staphylococcus capitis]PTH04680.1 hypothetical protein BU621_06930 [Staphylococcus capitis]